MQQINILDLHFLSEQSVAAFLLPSADGPVLIETGPESTFEHLRAGIGKAGYRVEDVRHVLLTHIHLDHAGAAWKFAEHGATVYAHSAGIPHLADPTKLWNSASQIYGAEMDRLWGRIGPIPEAQLRPVADGDIIRIGELSIKVWYTPGHAVHHNIYQIGDSLFTGDVAGVRIGNGPVQPPCPPPDINIELWLQSIKKIRELDPTWLYLTHFGKQSDPQGLLLELEGRLQEWANWIKPFFDQGRQPQEMVPAFQEMAAKPLLERGLSQEELLRYEYANPSWMSVTGLFRYWGQKAKGRI